jgi:hypothetical protein
VPPTLSLSWKSAFVGARARTKDAQTVRPSIWTDARVRSIADSAGVILLTCVGGFPGA